MKIHLGAAKVFNELTSMKDRSTSFRIVVVVLVVSAVGSAIGSAFKLLSH